MDKYLADYDQAHPPRPETPEVLYPVHPMSAHIDAVIQAGDVEDEGIDAGHCTTCGWYDCKCHLCCDNCQMYLDDCCCPKDPRDRWW